MLILLSNAIKFTSTGSVDVKVKLFTEELGEEELGDEEQWLEVSVKDTGIGIKESEQQKLFKLFEFVKVTSDDVTQGIGLGLVV